MRRMHNMNRKESLRVTKTKMFGAYSKAKKFKNVPKLTRDQELEKIDLFLRAGKGKKYPYAASQVMADSGDLINQNAINNCTIIKVNDDE